MGERGVPWWRSGGKGKDLGRGGEQRWEHVLTTRFLGQYGRSLDAKGRVILPSKFRQEFGDSPVFLTLFLDGCLALWRPEEFENQTEQMLERAERGQAERHLARVWAARAAELKIDAQGRVPLPPVLREYAGLESEVIAIGAITRVELWNPAKWEQTIAAAEGPLAGVAATGLN